MEEIGGTGGEVLSCRGPSKSDETGRKGGLSRVDVGCQKIAEMKGLGGDVASCRGLPVNCRSSGRRGAVAVCQHPRKFGMHEERGGAATSCRSLSEDGRNRGEMVGDMTGIWQKYLAHHKGCISSHASSEPYDRRGL